MRSLLWITCVLFISVACASVRRGVVRQPGLKVAAQTGNLDEPLHYSLRLDGIGPMGNANPKNTVNSPEVEWLKRSEWAQRAKPLGLLSLGAEPHGRNVTVEDVRQTFGLGWKVDLMAHTSPGFRSLTNKLRGTGHLVDIETTLEALRSSGHLGDVSAWFYEYEDDSSGTSFANPVLRAARSAGFTGGATRLSSTEVMDMWENGWVKNATDALAQYLSKFGIARDSITLANRPGYASNLHSVARTNWTDMISCERAIEEVGSVMVALAFGRGASRQYSFKQHRVAAKKGPMPYGLDLSTSWKVGKVSTTIATYHRRLMWITYFSGAGYTSIESDGWIDHNTNTPNYLAQEVETFMTMAISSVTPQSRGTADRRMVIVIPSDLGFSEQPTSWNAGSTPQRNTRHNYANLPPTPTSLAFTGIIERIFSGTSSFAGYESFPFGKWMTRTKATADWSRCSQQPPYAPDPLDVFDCDSDLPFGRFGDSNDATKWIQDTGADPSAYRPMESTPFGDYIDIFVNESDRSLADNGQIFLNNIGSYPAVVCMTSLESCFSEDSGAPLKKLTTYLASGGTVVASAGVVNNSLQHSQLTGLVFDGVRQTVRGVVSQFEEGAAKFWDEAVYVANATLNASMEVELLAANAQPGTTLGDIPVVAEAKHGKGRFITVTVPWLHSRNTCPDFIASGVLGSYLLRGGNSNNSAAVAPVRVFDPISAQKIAFTSMASPAHRIVAVSDSSGERNGRHTVHVELPASCSGSSGGVQLKNVRISHEAAILVGTEADHSVKVSLALKPFDVAVFSLAC